MISYVIRRLLYTVPVVLGVTLIVFFLFNVVGGDPVAVLLGKNPKPRDVRDLRRKYGLDKPLFFNTAYLRDLSKRVPEHLERAAKAEGPARQEALQRIFDYGDAAVPALVDVVLEGPDDLKPPASEILGEMTGHAASYPGAPAGPKKGRDDGGEEDPGAEKDDGEGKTSPEEEAAALAKAREASLASWRTWWEGNRDRYAPGALERVGLLFDAQYFHFLWGAIRFDFGRSMKQKQKIAAMIGDGIGPSLSLSVPAFTLGILFAIYISLLCAFYRNSWVDRGIVILSVLGMSLSMLIYIIACQYLFAFRLNWFPLWGYQGGAAAVTYLILPVFIWVLVALGSDVRFFRTVMLDEINQDYVRTASAKGLTHNKVLFKHVLKNAMIPIITRVVIAIPFLYTGSLLLERFFGIPGLGNMLVDALQNSDLTVVRAMTFIGAILYVLGNLVTDVGYALVDPRIRLG